MKIVQFTIPVAIDNSIYLQEDKLPHFYEHLHRHNETQITWVISGEGTLIAGNTMQRFQSGDLFVIGANQPHLFKNDPAFTRSGGFTFTPALSGRLSATRRNRIGTASTSPWPSTIGATNSGDWLKTDRRVEAVARRSHRRACRRRVPVGFAGAVLPL